MSQRDEKARKRARKKAEDERRHRQKNEQKKQPPQRILTDYARSIVNHFPEHSSKRQQFEMNFQIFLLRVQRLPFAEAWQEALDLIARAMRETAAPISCQRGCSACCHLHVGLSKAEGGLIEEFLRLHPLSIDEERLQRQQSARTWNELSFAERRCVFLGEEGECRIYEVRPLTSRRYAVTSDPLHCRNETKGQILSTLHGECDAYLSAFLTHYGHVSLPEFLATFKTES